MVGWPVDDSQARALAAPPTNRGLQRVVEVVREPAESFEAWAAARQHGLLRSAYLLTGDMGRAEDLLQEALLKVALRWQRLAGQNPDAYARVVIYRDQVSWWRKRRPYPLAEPPERAVVTDADASERHLMLREALGHLTHRQRAVLVLRYYDDLTERQTAEALGVSVGTVKSQTSAALARLRERAPGLQALLGREEP